MRFVSLFSGCGGMDLGLERAGHECVCQVEIDERPLAILHKRWPHVPKIIDVKNANRRTLPAFDLLAGGFPCTDTSLAGQRKGLAGDASGLWFEMRRVALQCRPSVVIIENVPGLFSSGADCDGAQAGEDFAVVLSGLLGFAIEVPQDGWKRAGIAKGQIYHVAWRVLDSQFFGVAQQRRRVFIAACLASCGINPAEILFERQGVRRDYSASRKATEAIACASGSGPAFSGVRGGQVSSTLSQKFNGAEQAGRLVVVSLTSGGGGADDNDAQSGRIVGTISSSPSGGFDSDQKNVVVGALKSQGMQGYNVEGFPYVSADKAPTLNASFATKQGLENQHIDSGGGCFVTQSRTDSQRQMEKRQRRSSR